MTQIHFIYTQSQTCSYQNREDGGPFGSSKRNMTKPGKDNKGRPMSPPAITFIIHCTAQKHAQLSSHVK